jgi:uncharacterized membrane protein
MKRFWLGHYLGTSLWFVPLLCVLGGIALSVLTTTIDDGSLFPQSLVGDPAAAGNMLNSISTAMLTLTGLVLTLVVVVVQLAMGQFSPRIVRQVLQDRPSQAAIGIFAATFAHSILAMRAVKMNPPTVPGLAIAVAILLVLVSIAVLIFYVNHVGQTLRAAALIESVTGDTKQVLERLYRDRGADPEPDSHVITAPRSGVVFRVDHDRLVELAAAADCRLELLWSVGDFVPRGASLFHVDGDPVGLTHEDVVGAVALGSERTLNQDVAYGFTMLVDIAERSLSSGPFQDPTTAVQAIDRLHELLRELARRPFPSGLHHDERGTLRLVTPTMHWEGYVRLAFDEIRLAGAGSPPVTRRMKSALDDLLTVAPPERRPVLEGQLELLEKAVADAGHGEADRRAALTPDPVGMGSSDGHTAAVTSDQPG